MNDQQLNRIVISGYKSIASCDLKLGMINVLIGSNGSGKSNFISVFRLLQDMIKKDLALHVNRQGGVNSMLYNGRKITEKIKLEFIFGENGYKAVLIPTDDNRLIFEGEFFEYRPYAYRGVVARGHSESQWEKGTHNGTDDYILPVLKDLKWRVFHFHDTGKDATVKQEHSIENNEELQYHAGNLAAFLYRLKKEYVQSYREIIEHIQLIAPYFDDFVLRERAENSTVILEWKQRGCEDIFNASQLSDGTLRFICLATLLLQPSQLQPATIIIDEPELGLHPYAITILAEIVKSISEKKQVILSTQSVELLNEFEVEHIIVVNRGETGSKFERLNEDELRLWLEDDYSLGELWKKNILGGRLSI